MAIEHQPPEYFELSERQPLIFLAGPIQGAPDWQTRAGKRINDHRPDRNFHIANPRRTVLADDFIYDEQVAWEKRYLKKAARCGGIVFWFAARDYRLPYADGRAYAKTTHKEFHRAIGWLDMDSGVQLSVGFEPAYLEDPTSDTRYLLHTIHEFPLPIFDNLEETVDHAVARSF